MNEPLELLLNRRSVKAVDLGEPGPTAEQLEAIIRAGIRVPDHGKLGPWRFIRFVGAARETFGVELVRAWQDGHPDDAAERAEIERGRLCRAPVVVAVISRVTPAHKIPEWEQILSAGAVCQNMLNAAHALGFAAQWLTEWYAYDHHIRGVLELSEHERVAGWIHIGTPGSAPAERARPELEAVVSDFGA